MPTWHYRQVFKFTLSCVCCPCFMSISPLLLKLWQFSLIRDWPEIWKSEIPPSEFCLTSEDCGKLGIPKSAWMLLMKSYWMLQYARVAAFTVSELLREKTIRIKGLKLPNKHPLSTKYQNKEKKLASLIVAGKKLSLPFFKIWF